MEKDNALSTKVALIVLQLITLITFLPWFAIFGLSFMSFDQGYSHQATAFVFTIGLYPIIGIVTAILSWKKYKGEDFKRAVWLSATPLILVISFIAFLAIVSEI